MSLESQRWNIISCPPSRFIFGRPLRALMRLWRYSSLWTTPLISAAPTKVLWGLPVCCITLPCESIRQRDRHFLWSVPSPKPEIAPVYPKPQNPPKNLGAHLFPLILPVGIVKSLNHSKQKKFSWMFCENAFITIDKSDYAKLCCRTESARVARAAW